MRPTWEEARADHRARSERPRPLPWWVWAIGAAAALVFALVF